VQDGIVRDVRIAAGGVGTRPWRLAEVETALRASHPTPPRCMSPRRGPARAARPATQNGFKQILLRRAVCVRCRPRQPDEEPPWQSSGQGIDRIDGRLKVTGARATRRNSPPPARSCGAGQSTIGAGSIIGFRHRSGGRDARRAGDHHARQCAET